MRGVALSLGLVLALWCGAPGGVQAADPPSPTLALIEQHLLARGATRVTELARTFLFEGEAFVREERLEQGGCVGYLAVGTGEVRDVDLGLYTRSGQPLAEDTAAQPFAYARGCGGQGLDLYVSTTLYAGRGELMLLRIEGAPRGLDRLPEAIPFAVAAGGRLESSRAVGSAPDELVLDAQLEREERALGRLGYRALAPATPLELRAGTSEGELWLQGQRCYRVLAVVPFSRGVSAQVAGPRDLAWEARSAHDDRAEVAVCAPETGMYHMRVQARPMRGLALVRAFEHPGASAPDIRALGPARALAWGEADHVARSRGFQLVSAGEAWVEGSMPHVWPVSLEAGSCYALAVIAEGGPAAVDMRLTDERGVLLARNEGRRGVPMVFSCPSTSSAAQLVLRARGPDAKMAVWIGRNVLRSP